MVDELSMVMVIGSVLPTGLPIETFDETAPVRAISVQVSRSGLYWKIWVVSEVETILRLKVKAG